MSFALPSDWVSALAGDEPSLKLGSLYACLDQAYTEYPDRVNPAPRDVFRAFALVPVAEVRVVILGQDPYPGHGVADGLAFSTRCSVTPMSLRNIKAEIASEYGTRPSSGNDLTFLAEQGVLLLNTSLISLDSRPLFFGEKAEFKEFSTVVVRLLSRRGKVVFLMLGGKAQQFSRFVDRGRNTVLETSHPSPLSAHRGFLGSGIFKKANEALEGMGYRPIDWSDGARDLGSGKDS